MAKKLSHGQQDRRRLSEQLCGQELEEYACRALEAKAKGQFDLAIECCDQALREYPKNILILSIKGKSLFIKGKSRESLSVFMNIFEINPSNDEARAFIREISEMKPGH